MSDHIKVEIDNHIALVTFNRADKKNAFTVEMYESLVEVLRSADKNPDVRVLVVTGAGDAFTSGNDLLDFMNTPPAGKDSPVFQVLTTLVDLETPLIAAVNGAAIGIGTTMLLHCDLVYASSSAKFQMPFVNLGLCPEGASSLLLPMMMGIPKATELLLFGDKLPAERACDVGLVNAVVDDVLGHAMERARVLAAKAPASVRLTKALIRSRLRKDVHEAMGIEGDHFLERLQSDEAKEAFGAFFEKRAPDFSKFS